ncbi:MAG TPA: hypothetical protein VH063_07065 [Gaiellaceae bacterium]|jgi:hypothetical protein|nr:hypothetical protein [Gaiellaceae bacterium]
MVLALSDFPAGATIVSANAKRSSFMLSIATSSSYARTFSGVVIGHTRLLTLFSAVQVASNAAKAEVEMQALTDELSSKTLRSSIGRGFSAGLGQEGFASAHVVRDRTLKAGDTAVDLGFSFKSSSGGAYYAELMYVEKGPEIATLLIVSGQPGLSAGQSTGIAKTVVAHIEAATTPPANTTAPTVGGTVGPGSILSSKTGTWSGPGLTFAYSWLRCDATGAACTPIAGATSASYTVSNADVGATLALEVAATNAASTVSATSKPTAVVQPS